MLTNPDLPRLSPSPAKPSLQFSPARSLAILAVIIFLAELVTMGILYFLKIPAFLPEALVDGFTMIALILPALYFLQLKPLLDQIELRDRVENALRASEGLFRKVLELLPVGVWITGPQGQVIHGNPVTQDIWEGIRYVGMEGYGQYKGWWADSGKPVRPEEWGGARAIARGETSLNEEVEIETFSGKRKTILNSSVPILDEGNTIQGAIIVNQDITRRRQAEKGLVRTNELLERFFASIGTLIAYMDRDFNFIRVNETYARSAGHLPEFFAGKNHFDLYPHEENQAIFRQVVETGEPFSVLEKSFDYPEYPERGATYWDWSLQPVKATDGKVEGLVLSLVDVTERKLAQIQLARQNEELRGLYQAETNARLAAETLSQAALELTQTLDLEHVFDTLLDHLGRVVPIDTAGVTLLVDETNSAVRAVRGYGSYAEKDVIPSLPTTGQMDSLIHRLNSDRKSLMLSNRVDLEDSDTSSEGDQIQPWLVAPIIASEKVIGLVECGRLSQEPFSPEQVQWAEALVGQAGVAIQNAWLFDKVSSSSERLQVLAQRLVEAQANERASIARDLHDSLSQNIAFLRLKLEQTSRQPPSSPVAEIQPDLEKMQSVAGESYELLRGTLAALQPDSYIHLADLLQNHAGMVSERAGFGLTFNSQGKPFHLEPYQVRQLFFIFREALSNLEKHARASQARVDLDWGGDELVLTLADDGIGFDPQTVKIRGHYGLDFMRQRMDELGGSFEVRSAPGAGTTLTVRIPENSP